MMYVSNSYLDRFCTYCDMNDRDFFLAVIEKAKNSVEAAQEFINEHADEDRGGVALLKQNTPIIYISSLSKQIEIESVITRSLISSDRARRKFIMGDVDFDAGEEDLSNNLRNALISFADKYKTPLLIYPTISYPIKPRFRFVFLTNRVMNYKNYWKAVKWVYEQVGFEATDTSDFRLNANRNAPLFYLDEQVKNIYSTFNDMDLKPLDNSLWKDEEVPPEASKLPNKVKGRAPLDPKLHGVKFDPDLILIAARDISKSKICEKYASFWILVRALAASVICGGTDYDTAMKCLDEFSNAGKDALTRERWKIENRSLYDSQVSQLSVGVDYSQIVPLCRYREFSFATK